MSNQVRRRSPRQARIEQEIREEEEIGPELGIGELRRRAIINGGVGILLVAFLMTSGLTCVNLNSSLPSQAASPEANSQESQLVGDLKKWQEAVTKSPSDTNALGNLGYYQMVRATSIYATDQPNKEKDLSAAMGNFDAALKVDPNYGFAMQQKARIYMDQKKWDDARGMYEQALKSAERPVEEGDKNKEATERSRQGEQVQDHLGLAAVAVAQKKTDEAMTHVNKCIELDPGNPESYLMRAELYLSTDQKELARKDLDTISNIGKHTHNAQAQYVAQQMLYMIDNNIPIPKPGDEPTPTPGAPSTPATPAGVATP